MLWGWVTLCGSAALRATKLEQASGFSSHKFRQMLGKANKLALHSLS